MLKKFKKILINLTKINDTPYKIALGLGLGVFLGLFPGTGPLASIILASLFRLNLAACLSASIITNSWLSVVTFLLSAKLGAWLTGINYQKVLVDWQNAMKSFSFLNIFKISFLNIIFPLLLGYFLVGLALGGAVAFFSFVIIKRIRNHSKVPFR